MNNTRKIIENINSVLEEVRNYLPVETVKDAADLLDHVEWGEALSLICTQLYEYDVKIGVSTYEQIASLGQQIGMQEKEWSILNPLNE